MILTKANISCQQLMNSTNNQATVVQTNDELCQFSVISCPMRAFLLLPNLDQVSILRHAATPLSWSSLVYSVYAQGGSPGLVVMGGDSLYKGCGFKFRLHILDGYFSHIFVAKVDEN